LDELDRKLVKDLYLLTDKPVMYVCNVDEASAVTGNAYVEAVREAVKEEGAEILIVAAATEADIAELETYEERQMFLEAAGLAESGVARLIRAAYHLLDLQTYFTAGYSHAFSCLGTTLKKAGSKEQFYAIDYVVNAHFAELFVLTKTHYVLISALGAQANSKIFYNRVKGELEETIRGLDLYKVSILQPSLLIGQRNEGRMLEDIFQKAYTKLSHFIPKHFKYKPVTAEQVAHTMVEAAQTQTEKFEIYDNLRIQKTK
jgi:hypothetical protein